jgi:glutamate-1-semialdehyde 2,1-aminomutase
MIAFGKPVGGGFPAGAVTGKAEWMSELDPLSPQGKLEHGGTFSANPVSMEAGVAALNLLDADAIDRINSYGDRARARLKERVEAVGWEARGYGSIMRLFPLHQPDNKAVLELQRQLWWQAYERGVTLAKHGVCAFSTPMDTTVVDHVSEVLGEAAEAVAAGEVKP